MCNGIILSSAYTVTVSLESSILHSTLQVLFGK